MSAMSNYLEKKLLDHTLGKASYTMPTEVWLALFTADPTEAGSFTNEVSDTDTGYARVSITSLMSATNATTGTSANTDAVNFGPAEDDWGTITHTAIVDSATPGAGNILLFAPMEASRTIQNGDSLQFAASQVVATFA